MPLFLRRICAPLTNLTSEIYQSDLILSKGGGFLLDVGTSYKIPTHLVTIWLATLFKRDVVIYAQTIGPFESKVTRLLSRLVLQRVTLILARDEFSYEYTKKTLNIGKPELKLSADSAFYLALKDWERQHLDVSALRPKVCMSLVSPRFAGLRRRA